MAACRPGQTRRVSLITRVAGLALVVAGALVPATAYAQVTRLDVGPGGAAANGPSSSPVVSFDGRYAAFASTASNLVPLDTNGDAVDFFRYDAQSGQLLRGEITVPQLRPDQLSLSAISHDGRWLLFSSSRREWVAGDTNDADDAFEYDFATGAVRRVSVGSGRVQAEGPSVARSMSADGRYVAFESTASNISPPAIDNGPVSDVFVHDAETGETVQVTRGVGGLPADRFSANAIISPDGEWVAFASAATNLTVPRQANEVVDAYLARWRTGELMRVGPDRIEPNGATWFGLPNWDAAQVLTCSAASNLVPLDVNFSEDTFVWDRAGGTVTFATPAFLMPEGSCHPSSHGLSTHGRYLTHAQAGPLGVPIIVHHDLREGRTAEVVVGGQWFQMSHDGTVVVYGGQGGTSDIGGVFARTMNVAPDGLFPAGDADNDGLPNGWESRFGLDPSSATLDEGPSGDPDHDGFTNLQEMTAGTHPRGFHRRYLAEGVGGPFFDTRIAIANPGDEAARVHLRLSTERAATLTETLSIPARGHRTLNANSVVGLNGEPFSTAIESDVPVVVDRTVSWDATGYGAHSESAILAPAATWYLAEGSTSGSFSLFYLLQNPGPANVAVTIRFLRPGGPAPIVKTYMLAPTSRTTVFVDAADPALASTDVSGVVEAGAPIIVERAMYRDVQGQIFGAGHASAGVVSPSTRWFLAEGATGSFFELFVLLANPSGQTAMCEVRYLTSTGATYTRPYALRPNSRTTIWVDEEQIPGLGAVLGDAAVSTMVTSDVPIVVERTMWWPDGAWQEAHNSPGTTVTGSRWVVADGELVPDWWSWPAARAVRTYLLIANTSAIGGHVRVSLFFEGGARAERTFVVGGSSRYSVSVADEFPWFLGGRFWALVEATGPDPLELVVERAVYWDANGVSWAAGTSAPGTPWP